MPVEIRDYDILDILIILDILFQTYVYAKHLNKQNDCGFKCEQLFNWKWSTWIHTFRSSGAQEIFPGLLLPTFRSSGALSYREYITMACEW